MTTKQNLSKSLIIRGVVSLIFCALALVWPNATLLSIALLFGAYALVDGIVAFQAASRLSAEHRPFGLAILEGIVGVIAGVLAWLWPGITIVALAMITAAWALITGFAEIVGAFGWSWAGTGSRILLGLAGVVSIALGVAMLARPALGVVTFLAIVASYAFVFGITLIALGVRLKKLRIPEIEERRAA